MRAQSVRFVAAVAAAGSAILYYLIGFGMLHVGESTNGGESDLLGFGVVMGTMFLGMAAVTLFVTNRWILGATGLLDAIPLIGYRRETSETVDAGHAKLATKAGTS